MITITVIASSVPPFPRTFDQGLITIGRAGGNDIVLADSATSRRHATITRKEGDSGTLIYEIEDLGSAGGIFINDLRCSKATVLRRGDRIRLGASTLIITSVPSLRDRLPPPEIKTASFTYPFVGSSAIAVGQSFAFVHRRLYDDPALQALFSGLTGGGGMPPATHRVECLLGAGEVHLPGLTLNRHKPSIPELASVTSDKMLYQEGNDLVNLLVIDARRKGQRVAVEVRLNGEKLGERSVGLDASGLGHVELADPLGGSYEIRLVGTSAKCSYTAAGYSLVPLSASLLQHRYREHKGTQEFFLRASLRSYGLRYQERVSAELMDLSSTPPRRVSGPQVLQPDDEGVVSATFALLGQGPFSITLQAVDDPERTASLPLPGTRASERKLFSVSRLGEIVEVSLLPQEGSLESHGLHLLQTGQEIDTPLRLKKVVCQEAELCADVAIESLCVAMFDPTSGAVSVQRIGDVRKGQVVRLAVPAWYGQIFAGGFVGSEPWEGSATVLRPNESPVEVVVPERATPGSTLRVTLRKKEGMTPCVYLTVKDTRLQIADTPLSQMGACTKASIEELSKRTHTGRVDTGVGHLLSERLADLRRDVDQLRDALLKDAKDTFGIYSVLPSAPPGGGPPVMVGGGFPPPPNILMAMPMSAPPPPSAVMRSGAPLPPRSAAPVPSAPPPAPGAAPMWRMQEVAEATSDSEFSRAESTGVGLDLGEGAAPQGEASQDMAAEAEERQGEVLYCRLLTLSAEEEVVEIPLPEGPTTYSVDAFVVADWDFVYVRKSIQAKRDVFVSFLVPPFCDPRDTVWGRIEVSAIGHAEAAQVDLQSEGRAVPLYRTLPQDGEPLTSLRDVRGQPLGSEVTRLYFQVREGQHVATLVSGQRVLTQADVRISRPGRVSYLRQRTTLLQRGESVDLAALSGLRMRVLPGLAEPCGQLISATADYGYLCCEQTAAKILAASAMYLLAKEGRAGDAERRKAARIVIAGIEREERMWTPRKGFRMYPESDYFSDYYGPKAATYLGRLRPLASLDLPRELERAVARGLELAKMGAQVYGLPGAEGPPKLRSMEDAYLASEHPSRRKEALDYVRRELAGFANRAKGRVEHRVEEAYAAAVLIARGDRSDWKAALALANHVFAAFNESGRLYSTVDSVAAIALLSQLSLAGIGKAGHFLGDGMEMTASEEIVDKKFQHIQVEQGVVAVEVLTLEEVDLCDVPGDLRVRVDLVGTKGVGDSFTEGERVHLRVRLEDGYQAGDLLHVHLPPALTWVLGGGQVRALALDFLGQSELLVPLLCTSATVDLEGQSTPQHYALAVRNMFSEERGRGFPSLVVTVHKRGKRGGGSTSLGGRIGKALRDLIG